MKYWYINFADINNKAYQLRIYEDREVVATTATALQGASNPFYVNEDDDTDFFLPVRTQSGVISIIASDDSWHDIMPDSAFARPVELLSGTGYATVEWRGFVKPETYGSKFYEKNQQIDIPVICMLSALDAVDFIDEPEQEGETNPDGLCATWTPSFGETIRYLFEISMRDLVGWVPSVYYQQLQQDKEQDFESLLELCYSLDAVASYNENGTRYSTLSCYDMLEAIGNVLGITFRTFKGDVYVNINNDYLFSPVAQSTIALTSWPFRSLENTEQFVMGVKKATVRGASGADNVGITIPIDSILSSNANGPTAYTTYGTNGRRYYKSSVGTTYFYGRLGITANNNAGLYIHSYIDNYTANMPIEYELAPKIPTGYYAENIQYTQNKQFLNFYAVNTVQLSGGHMNLSFQTYRIDVSSGEAKRINFGYGIWVSVRCGSQYFYPRYGWITPSSEDSPLHEFLLGGLGVHDDDGNFSLDIPVPLSIGGMLEVGIVSGAIQGGNDYETFIDNFSLSYSRGQSRTESENTVIKKTSRAFPSEYQKDLMFATDTPRMRYGNGIMLNPSGVFFSGPNLIPENLLATAIKDYWSSRRHVLTFTLAESDMSSISPIFLYEIEGPDKIYVPISISHRYADGLMFVRYMEVKI